MEDAVFIALLIVCLIAYLAMFIRWRRQHHAIMASGGYPKSFTTKIPEVTLITTHDGVTFKLEDEPEEPRLPFIADLSRLSDVHGSGGSGAISTKPAH
jgi:hypothetical protein